MRLSCSFLFLFIIFISCTRINYSETTLAVAFQMAQQNNKKVFIVVGNSGCKKCDHYINSLNRDPKARKVLNEEFICLKVNQDKESGKEFSQITGCAFFPYSCFFDSEGHLLNLRIGDKDFSFTKIEDNEMNVYTYRELFNLPISFEAYKKRVSLSMKSWLLRNIEKQNKYSLEKALLLSKQSVEIHPYPYNLYTVSRLASALNDTLLVHSTKKQFKNIYTSYDDFLFSNLCNELGIDLDGYITPKKNSNIDYKFSKEAINFDRIKYKSKHKFECELTNIGNEPLIIKLARASCSCTDLEWTKKPIMPGKTGYVKGIFHAKAKGRFYKQIYVHVSSKIVPMSTVGIQGFVEKN